MLDGKSSKVFEGSLVCKASKGDPRTRSPTVWPGERPEIALLTPVALRPLRIRLNSKLTATGNAEHVTRTDREGRPHEVPGLIDEFEQDRGSGVGGQGLRKHSWRTPPMRGRLSLPIHFSLPLEHRVGLLQAPSYSFRLRLLERSSHAAEYVSVEEVIDGCCRWRDDRWDAADLRATARWHEVGRVAFGVAATLATCVFTARAHPGRAVVGELAVGLGRSVLSATTIRWRAAAD